jgi:hypothetical protein
MPWEALVAPLAARRPLVEAKLAVRADGTACGYWDDLAWFRGQPDCVLFDRPEEPTIAAMMDFKTGEVREDPDELSSHAVLLHGRHPTITRFAARYVWLAREGDEFGQQYELDWESRMTELHAVSDEIESCRAADEWPEERNGLCKAYCDVLACPFNGRGATRH